MHDLRSYILSFLIYIQWKYIWLPSFPSCSSFLWEHAQMNLRKILWFFQLKDSYHTIPLLESCQLALTKETYSLHILQCQLAPPRIRVQAHHHWACSLPYPSTFFSFSQKIHFVVGYMAWYFDMLIQTAYRNDQICFQRIHHHCESSTLYSSSLSDFHKIFKIFKYI